jgi:hypothetical protein
MVKVTWWYTDCYVLTPGTLNTWYFTSSLSVYNVTFVGRSP